MTFRGRLLVAFAAVVLVPLAVLAYGLWREVDRRLAAQYERRVSGLVHVVDEDLSRRGDAVAARLEALGARLKDDNRFRLAAVQGTASERAYLLDLAGQAMRLAGLSMLLILDERGRVLSSGHFREEYDRLAPTLPAALAATGARATLLRTRTAEGWFLALARTDSVRLGDRRFDLVGGAVVDTGFVRSLAVDPELAVTLTSPAGTISSAPAEAADTAVATGFARALTLPYVDPGASGPLVSDTAVVVVTQSSAELAALRRGVVVWFVGAAAATAGAALLLAAWLTSRLSRPLAALARKTEQLDLDTLDVRFGTARPDEIGALARLLDVMARRLQRSVGRLRDAERRATLGEMARQVNHDIRNGLTPIRNVLRHLGDVAREEPAALATVYEERRGTLDAGIAYLEHLAANYARLTPHIQRRPSDVNAVVRAVVGDAGGAGVAVGEDLAPDLPPVMADDVSLRRILENLVRNAIESLEGGAGTVTVATRPTGEPGRPAARITVSDTGCGMARDQLDKVFDDFYTTKESGTGLGLSVVRRLVIDLGGTLNVESEPGVGTVFIVEIPA